MARRRPGRRSAIAIAIGGAVALVLAALLVLGILGDAFEPLGELPHDAFAWVRSHGQLGAVAALYVEESGLPVFLPGDVFVVYLGRHVVGLAGWLLAWTALVTAVVLGSTNLYWISRRWGRTLLEGRIGGVLHLTPARLDQAERWFDRYGVWALIFGRHIPGFRVPITVAAGTLAIRYRVFVASVAVSSGIWVGTFLLVGMAFGRPVERWLLKYRINVAILATAILVAIVVGLAVRRAHRRPGLAARQG